MSDFIEDKTHAVVRLSRIAKQAESLEHSVVEGFDSGEILLGLAEMRGLINLLEETVLDTHLLALFGHADCSLEHIVQSDAKHERIHVTVDEMVALVCNYLL